MQKPLTRSASKRVIALLFVLALYAIPAHAQWFRDYESAIDLVKKNQWAAAIPKLQSAIAQKKDEGSNIKFYGMKFGDYFPHYYLGLAYFNEKNFQGAITEFEISERFGAIQKKNDLYSRLNNVRTLCKAQITSAEPPIAKNNPPEITPPVITTPPEKKEEPPPVKPEPTEIQKEPIKEPQQQTTVPTQNPADITQETAKMIAKQGALRYFSGDFDEAIGLLSTATEMNPQSAAIQFLLGCSYAAKYLLSGSQDQALYTNATSAFQRTKKIKPNYRFNRAYFSPAILDIYEKAS